MDRSVTTQSTVVSESTVVTESTYSTWNSRASSSTCIVRLEKKQRVVRLIAHAATCGGGGCVEEPHCAAIQTVYQHALRCNGHNCYVPRCHKFRKAIQHLESCHKPSCPICAEAPNYPKRKRHASASPTRRRRLLLQQQQGLPPPPPPPPLQYRQSTPRLQCHPCSSLPPLAPVRARLQQPFA